MKITLPKPGNLIVRYVIPRDISEAKPELRLITTNKDRLLWKDISFGLSFTVTDGGQIILTNLTPGIYHFRRWKSADREHGAETEGQTVLIEAGQTQHMDMVRTNGQRIRGQVIGLDQARASGGLIFVRSAEATGQPWPQRSRNEQNDFKFPTFDVLKFGADGTFETAMLKPGTYTIIAHVYPPQAPAGGFPYHPDFVGVTKVTITADAMSPVTIKLAPALFTDIAGHVVDDATGRPIQDFIIHSGTVNPDKRGEIIWSEGYQGGMMGFGVDAGQFSLRNQKKGAAFRVFVNGYLPETFTRDEVIASRQTANLQVRMKRGGELHGVVLDYAGWPVAGATLYLAPLELGYVRFGSIGGSSDSSRSVTYWAHTFATTDAAGHFSLRGVEGNRPRVIVVSSDGRLVCPTVQPETGQEWKITLPEPATLIVHYEIAGDVAEADFNLTLHTNDLEMPLWKHITLKPWTKVPNGGQVVLNNLTPGAYDFSRTRNGGTTNSGYAFLFGDPFQRVQSDLQTLVLESGRTQQVSIVRSSGQRVQGQVTGLESITNSVGSFVYVGSATAISNLLDFGAKLEPCFDAVSFDKNGLFQTALLKPGDYTLIAEVYVWGKPPEPKLIRDDEPQFGDMGWFSPQRLAYVGSAKVTVTAGAVPPPVKIELHPWVEPAKSP